MRSGMQRVCKADQSTSQESFSGVKAIGTKIKRTARRHSYTDYLARNSFRLPELAKVNDFFVFAEEYKVDGEKAFRSNAFLGKE